MSVLFFILSWCNCSPLFQRPCWLVLGRCSKYPFSPSLHSVTIILPLQNHTRTWLFRSSVLAWFLYLDDLLWFDASPSKCSVFLWTLFVLIVLSFVIIPSWIAECALGMAQSFRIGPCFWTTVFSRVCVSTNLLDFVLLIMYCADWVWVQAKFLFLVFAWFVSFGLWRSSFSFGYLLMLIICGFIYLVSIVCYVLYANFAFVLYVVLRLRNHLPWMAPGIVYWLVLFCILSFGMVIEHCSTCLGGGRSYPFWFSNLAYTAILLRFSMVLRILGSSLVVQHLAIL